MGFKDACSAIEPEELPVKGLLEKSMKALRNGPFPQMSGAATLTQHGVIRKRRMHRYVVLQGSSLGYARTSSSAFEREMTIKRARPGKHSGDIVIENTRGHIWRISVEPTLYRKWLDALLSAQNRELERFYRPVRVIGNGAFSQVMECQDRNDPSMVFAVKIIDKKRFALHHIDMFRREVQVHMSARHPGVVSIVDVFETEDHMHIVQEIMNSDLFEMLTEEVSFPEPQARHLLRDMLEAVAHLHRIGIVHRDLKPENVFATSKTWPSTLKLADFGLSRFYRDDDATSMTSFVGTSYYVAPEIVSQEPYGFAVDCWSVGVILYELLSGERPFDGGKDEERTLKLVLSVDVSFDGPQWRNVSTDAMSLIRGLLQRNPHKRLTAAAALHHRWLDPLSSDTTLASRLSKMTTSITGATSPRLSSAALELETRETRSFVHVIHVVFAVRRLCDLVSVKPPMTDPADTNLSPPMRRITSRSMRSRSMSLLSSKGLRHGVKRVSKRLNSMGSDAKGALSRSASCHTAFSSEDKFVSGDREGNGTDHGDEEGEVNQEAILRTSEELEALGMARRATAQEALEFPDANQDEFPAEIVRSRPRDLSDANYGSNGNGGGTSSSMLFIRLSGEDKLDLSPPSPHHESINGDASFLDDDTDEIGLETENENETESIANSHNASFKRSKRWSKASGNLKSIRSLRHSRSTSSVSSKKKAGADDDCSIDGDAPPFRSRKSISDYVRSRAAPEPVKRKKKGRFWSSSHK